MAEAEATAVLEPVAETAPIDETPLLGETVDETETETVEDAETQESFTPEQVEERIKEVEARIRAEAEAQQEQAERSYQRQQVEAGWQQMAGDVGMNALRKFAVQGAKLALDGRVSSPDEVARLVEPIHAQQFLDLAKNTFMPYATGEVLKGFTDFGVKEVETMFPDWKPSRETETKFRDAIISGDGTKAAKGLISYIRAAIEESEVPEKVKAELKGQAQKNKTAAEVEAMKRTTAGGPSRVGGAGAAGPLINNMDAADAAYNRGQLTGSQYAEYAKKFGVSLG